MKKQRILALFVGFFLGHVVPPLWAEHVSADLILGDRTFPLLRIWQFMDRVVNPRLFISTTANPGEETPTFLYSRVPAGVTAIHSPFGSAVRLEGDGEAVGGFLYAENEGRGVAYGANTFATTYSGAPAIGLEVNGVNFSGNPSAAVRGIDIVNGGNAPTEWALAVGTSLRHPAGKPRYGIILAGSSQGSPHAPASETGILVDHIDSGEAIRIQADNRIAFNKEGTIYMKYNPRTNRLEFYNGSTVKFSIPMG